MLPEPIPVLKDKDAKEFLKYDSRPLSKADRKTLEKADKIYAQIKKAR